jgi:hypothetical protein
MGGRRSYSINSVISKSPDTSVKKANLTKALKNEDTDAITRSSTALFNNHRDLAKIFVLSDQLLNVVLKKYKPEDFDTVKQIASIVRKDWALLKAKQEIISDKILDDSVIYSVSKYLKLKKK